MKYKKLLILLLITFTLISCKKVKNRTEMLKTNINPCGIKNEDLNISYIKNNINHISENENCIFYILDNIIKDYNKDKDKAISIFEVISSNVSLEPLIDYSKDFFEKTPRFMLEYLNKNPNSSIKENIIFGYNIDTKYGQEIKKNKYFFEKLRNQNLTKEQRQILESIYDSIIFNHRGIIVDKDGYANLRKDKNVNSDIIKTIDSGKEVVVRDTIGDWWGIETNEGVKGFIHKTRVHLK